MSYRLRVGHAGALHYSPCQHDERAGKACAWGPEAPPIGHCSTHNTAERFHPTISIQHLMHVVPAPVMAGVDPYLAVW